ncbi:DUF6053 domain-containing protein [Lysobacter enzymogenes]
MRPLWRVAQTGSKSVGPEGPPTTWLPEHPLL